MPMKKKIYIETYGCQMNVNDTEVIFSILARKGYARTEEMSEADVILANTCSVRDNAEQRIHGRIDVFAQQKKARPGVIVGIVGCMAERLKDKLLESGKVDIVAGPDAYRSLPRLLDAVSPGNPQIDVLLSHEETYADIAPVRIDKGGVSAFISIMRGCNNVCSYCVVPYTRGAERSRDPHSIVREACDVFSRGYREVTLLGQNVDSYRWTSCGWPISTRNYGCGSRPRIPKIFPMPSWRRWLRGRTSAGISICPSSRAATGCWKRCAAVTRGNGTWSGWRKSGN